MDERLQRLKALHWLLPAIAALIWFSSIQATSFDRIRLLHNVEGYALAVYNQLVWSFSEHGHFFQTIHFGYDDSWMWSGHRSVMLPIVSWIYGFSPGPVFLCRIQIAILALGIFPAYALGRVAIGGTIGGLIGLLMYGLYPPLAVIALNDYQDVILGVPFLLGAMYFSRTGSNIGFVVMAFLTCFAREEWIVMVPLIGVSVPGSLKNRAIWVAKGMGVAAVMGGVLWLIGSEFKGHDNPMASHMSDLLVWPPPITRSMFDVRLFYLEFLKPFHFMSLFSPAALAPAFGPLFFHLTAPADGGVDTNFAHHIHHMAPVAAWVIAASIDGTGIAFRLLKPLGKIRMALMVVFVVVLGVAGIQNGKPWLAKFDIKPQLLPSVRFDPPSAPEWALVANIPKDAAIASDVNASLIISTRDVCYTYDESLRDKAPKLGLKAVEYILVNRRHTPWLTLAKSWPEAEVLGETRDYVLYYLPKESLESLPPGPLFPAGHWLPTTPTGEKQPHVQSEKPAESELEGR